MKIQRPFFLRQALAGLAMSFVLAAPAIAGHGYCGAAYPHVHPYCHGGYGAPAVCPHYGALATMTKTTGKSLGVMIRDLGNLTLDREGLDYGVKVVDVLPDSAAAAAGLRAGDVIVEFGGKAVTSADRLRWLVRQAEAGKALDIKVMRDKAPVTLAATLVEPEAREKCETPAKQDKTPPGV